MSEPLTADQANAAYDLLVQHVGASEDGRDDFVFAETEGVVLEYRFMGTLGYGGKFWRATGLRRDQPDLRWSVRCYPEDLTPARQSAVDATNAALVELHRRVTQ